MLEWNVYHLLLAITFIAAFIVFVFATRGQRSISNIVAWLFFMFIIPYIGIPLFLIFGRRKLDWLLKKKKLVYADTQRKTINRDNPLERLLSTFNIMPATENNSITLLDCGEKAYNTITEAIQSAQQSILISTYLIGHDDIGQHIVSLLTKKANQGIQVCLLLDTVGNFMHFPRDKLRQLKKAGGCIRYMMPLSNLPFRNRINLRSHRKIMIFDGNTAIIGGMNIAEEYMGPSPNKNRWTDLSLFIQGNTVNDLLSVFESDWRFAASNMEFKRYKHPKTSAKNAGNAVIQTVTSGPDIVGDTLYDAILSSIANAKKSIYIITPYFILDDALQKAFMIALRLGIQVNIIIPRNSNHRIPDLVRGMTIRLLRSAGAKIYYYPKMLHAKAMLFDDTLAIVGSANMDLRSLLLNFEISCFIYSKPEIEQLQQWANNLIIQCDTQPRKHKLIRLLLEDAAQLIKPLL